MYQQGSDAVRKDIHVIGPPKGPVAHITVWDLGNYPSTNCWEGLGTIGRRPYAHNHLLLGKGYMPRFARATAAYTPVIYCNSPKGSWGDSCIQHVTGGYVAVLRATATYSPT
ncbi:hypothetical protein LR48_Vigan03g100800 [Vigna angularis]|uniref:Neprosin domain-containing protein n=1 Tax=Phaseolus angularis TaxID=3914 RepID=A0A0L9U4C3_PHAAN|nr:hypothetical protein LR48_Vigan03g100800 [Vigna angularis]